MKKKTQSSKVASKVSNKVKTPMLGLLTATGIFLVLDQVSKFIAMRYMNVSLNEGVAFGLKIGRFFTIALTALLIVLLLKIILNEFNLKKFHVKVLSGMILGGAIGNLIDRIYLGRVIDFISVPYWPTFNLADIFIVIGIISAAFLYKKLSIQSR